MMRILSDLRDFMGHCVISSREASIIASAYGPVPLFFKRHDVDTSAESVMLKEKFIREFSSERISEKACCTNFPAPAVRLNQSHLLQEQHWHYWWENKTSGSKVLVAMVFMLIGGLFGRSTLCLKSRQNPNGVATLLAKHLIKIRLVALNKLHIERKLDTKPLEGNVPGQN